MLAIDVISRIVHVATAITLIGGSAFTLLVLLPAAKVLNDEAHRKLAAAIQSRWKMFVHAGIALFLLTGFYNYFQAIPQHAGDSLYHALLGTKIVLSLAVFFIAAALVGRSEKLEPIRRNRRMWLTILVVLATVIVAIAGYVKVRGVPAESGTDNDRRPVTTANSFAPPLITVPAMNRLAESRQTIAPGTSPRLRGAAQSSSAAKIDRR